MLEVGHTSSGMPVLERGSSSSAGSCTEEVPWPIRSAPSIRSASHTVCGPVVSPACGTLCRPAARAWSKYVLELRPVDADLGAAEAEADQRLGCVVERVAQRVRCGRRQPGLPGDVVDPAQPDAVVPLRRHPRVLDGLDVRLDRHARLHRGPRRQRQLGVADVLRGHLGGDLVGQQPDVLRLAEQVDDREVDLDEVPEVAERVEVAQRVEVGGHGAGVPGGELGDDPRRGGADVVDVDLGLGQARDERGVRRHGLGRCAHCRGPSSLMGATNIGRRAGATG